MNTEKQTFTFGVTAPYTLTEDEVKARFIDWLEDRREEWVKHYKACLIIIFIQRITSSKDEELDRIIALLQPVKEDYLKRLE